MTKQEAENKAEELKAIMGEGWKISVYEHSSLAIWQYCVYRPPISIVDSLGGGWYAFIGSEKPEDCYPCFEGHSGKSPWAAIEEAITNAEAALSDKVAAFEAAQAILLKARNTNDLHS